MTVKNLLETMVELPDRVVLIDIHQGVSKPFNLHNHLALRDFKRYHYGKTVEKWILEKISSSPKITDIYQEADKGWKETIYIQIKSNQRRETKNEM